MPTGVRVRLPPRVQFTGMMELVVMLDLKSSGHYARAGSTPAPGTIIWCRLTSGLSRLSVKQAITSSNLVRHTIWRTILDGDRVRLLSEMFR